MKYTLTLLTALLLAPFAALRAAEVSPSLVLTKPDWKVLDCAVAWVGNSFGGMDGKFVQHDTECLFVTADGTCLMNVPWEEGGRGTHVGMMKPGHDVGGPSDSGRVDLPYGLRATRRSNGEYVVFVEEDYRGKNVMYRWSSPPAQLPPRFDPQQ